MDFNSIGGLNKINQSNIDQRFSQKEAISSAPATETTSNPSAKTYITESTTSTKFKNDDDPYKELEKFMKMSEAEKAQYLWLKKNGISPEEFEAMAPEDKQKLMDQMQEDIKKQLKQAIESPPADKSNLDIS
jgi:hypothetical protein